MLGRMQVILMNILEDFKPLVVKEKTEWILLRAPWQPTLEEEHLIQRPADELPVAVCMHLTQEVLNQWFGKDALATQQ